VKIRRHFADKTDDDDDDDDDDEVAAAAARRSVGAPSIDHRYPTYESVDTQQDEVDRHGDRSVAVHHRPRHRLVVLEEIRQQALLVRRIAKQVPR